MRARRIFLKTLEESRPGAKDKIIYKEFLKSHLERAGAQGITVGQMRSRLSLLAQLDAATDYIDLDHKVHEGLSKELDNERWAVVTANIVTFCDDIRDATDALSANVIEIQKSEPVAVAEQPAAPGSGVADLTE